MPDAPANYPSQYESRITLKGGREVFLRPVLETDAPLLVDLFNKLSPESRYLRFLRYMDSLPDHLLYRFTHVNYTSEFALMAVIQEDGRDAIIGVGRYAYDTNLEETDLAVAVRDDWQKFGLGKLLLEKTIAIGREHGVSRFVSVLDPRNNLIRHIIANMGYQVKYYVRGGSLQMEIRADSH
ncbi:MAG: GNAT family N-acetyltransferase [Syntrophaceae bacterium]